ncbi:MAG: GDSL-type esterase/lipase family protein, partial [Candidatus Berkiella sp.]
MVIFHPKNKRLHRFFFKYVALTTLIYLILSVPSHANPILLVLGDSLSAAYQIPPEDGWVSLLEDRLKKTYPDAVVINSSIVGDTTANGLERLPGLLEKHHPTIVIIELGGNDGLRGLSVKAIQDNLNKMISLSLG